MSKIYERPVVRLESFTTDAILTSVEFDFSGEMLGEEGQI